MTNAREDSTRTGKCAFGWQNYSVLTLFVPVLALELLSCQHYAADEFLASLSLPFFALATLNTPVAKKLRYRSKKKAFVKSSDQWKDNTGAGSLAIDENFNKIKKHCKVVRAICHTQVCCPFGLVGVEF